MDLIDQSPTIDILLFSHNDVHENNIIINDCCDKVGKLDYKTLRFIDVEFSEYGYRGFEFANHFNEWMFDYTNPTWPYFHYNPEHFPTNGTGLCYYD